MDSLTLRKKFLDFFAEREHTVVPSSSLLPADPSVLFTTAGMQQFKEYFLGKESPYGNKVVSCQKCFRTSDIEAVGDEAHLTFLEMLGNFSFGAYFKEEAIRFSYEFLFKKLKLPLKEALFTVFRGDKEVPPDEDSIKIWEKLGIPRERIKKCGRADNFWGPTGLEGPCGPTTEIHFRGVELWNLVFNEYYQSENKNLTLLEKKGVDTGMGLERLAMVVQQKPSVFETDLFLPIIQEIGKKSYEPYSQNPKPYRIIVDHTKGAVFLAAEGVLPSNVERGYVLRRILRRAIRFSQLLGFPKNFLILLAKEVIKIYQDQYRELKSKEADILTIIQAEEEKFSKTLERGLKQFKKIASLGDISGTDAFHLFDTYGFPLELTEELAREKGLRVDKEGFEEAFRQHREVSRAGAEKKFGGVGREAGYQQAKLHTATHLLHSALRQVLGGHVQQMGSDITPQRLRFDFTHPQKMTEEEIKEVENLVNKKIKEGLEVKKEEMPLEEALKKGALAFFRDKYPGKVSVYSIGDFSKEICAGPHVENTNELGHFKIVKEESSGAGVRRIRAILE